MTTRTVMMTLDAFMAKARCDRCGRRYRKRNDYEGHAWNSIWDMGVLVGVRCPECQTPEDNAEAEFNLAVFDYGKSRQRPDGRMEMPLKQDAA